MIQATVETLLRDKIGLAAGVLNSQEIGRCVERRRVACNLPDLETYLQKLQTSTQELEELIELIIVPETWFFRDWEPFVFLGNYVASERYLTQNKGIFRVLSVPCSTGEEPYSIAMTLMDAGLTPERFRIDAVDISKLSLLKAKQGIYNHNSFRGNNLEFQKRYFTKIDDKYQLIDRVKNAVNFLEGNLVDPKLSIDKANYDAIFCRNVLIYFDAPARKQSMENLNRLLREEGVLFLGHAETGNVESGFVSVRHPFAFAYRKKSKIEENIPIKEQPKLTVSSKGNSERISESPQLDRSENSLPQSKSFKTVPLKDATSPPTPKTQNSLGKGLIDKSAIEAEKYPKKPPSATQNLASSQFPIPSEGKEKNSTLETARKLADDGKLNEAAKLCEAYLKQNCTSVEAYILLGEICQAKGSEEQAEQYFEKAIYLEPNNYETLMHLILLKEHRGDIARATVLRQRIQRLQKS